MGLLLFSLSALTSALPQWACHIPGARRLRRMTRSAPSPGSLRQIRLTAFPKAATSSASGADRIPFDQYPQASDLRRPGPALRVVRTVEAGLPAGSCGRMMISGRISDVCAELDRLAACESRRDNLLRH